MIVLMFQPRFAPLVAAGTKLNTIRPDRHRPVKAGDLLSLRTWSGKAYRSPQQILRPLTPCTQVSAIYLGRDWIDIEDKRLDSSAAEALARSDGFMDFDDMLDWFAETHSLPFYGVLIRWQA